MDNKQLAVAFLELVVARKIDEAYAKYVDMKGKHHNVYFPAGFSALRQGMIDAHTQFPNTQLSIKHVISEGDLVAVHSHVMHKPGDAGVSVVHLFRIKKNKIVEMWDVGQQLPDKLLNKDGAF